MTEVLLLHYAQTYLRIKARRAIWVQGFNGLWHSDFKEPLTKYQMRFDEEIWKQIWSVVRRISPTPTRKSAEEIIKDAER